MGFWTVVVVVLLVVIVLDWRRGDDSDNSEDLAGQTQSTSALPVGYAHHPGSTSPRPLHTPYHTTPGPPIIHLPPYAYQHPSARSDSAPTLRSSASTSGPTTRSPNVVLESLDVRTVVAPAPLPARDVLSLSWTELRERAAEEGGRMEELFVKSRTFRENGFRDEARRLALQGRECQRTMEALNKTASEMIFQEKNKDREPDELDLHGLYVKEAELKVKEAILAAEERGCAVVRFIVGQGHHTADGKARLKPALMSYIREMPRAVELDPRNAGVLVVSLALNCADDQGPTRPRKKVKRVGGRGRPRRGQATAFQAMVVA